MRIAPAPNARLAPETPLPVAAASTLSLAAA